MNISSLNSLSYTTVAGASRQTDELAGQEAAAFWQQVAAMRALASSDDDDEKQRQQAFGQQQVVQQHVAPASVPMTVQRADGQPADEDMVSSDADIQAMVSRSANAANNTNAGGSEQSAANADSKAETLLNKLFEQLLANRLGIDKKRMDDIKKKLQELEQLKQELSKADEQTPALEKQLKLIDEQMLKLKEELETLVKQATERLKQQTEDKTATAPR